MTTDPKTDGQTADEDRPLGLTPERREELGAVWDQLKEQDDNEPEGGAGEPADEEPKDADDKATEPDDQDASGTDADAQDKEPEPKAKEDDDLDHGEKSRLGRRLKRLQDQVEERDRKLEEMFSKVDQLTGHIQALSGGGINQDVDDGPRTIDDLDDDAVLTGADLKRIRQLEQAEAAKARQAEELEKKQYEEGYYKAILAYEDEEDFDQLFEALTSPESPYNTKHSDNAALDVRTNIAEARYALSSKASSKNKNPNLKQKKAEGTGVGGDDKVTEPDPKGVDVSKLSPQAQELLKHVKAKGRDPQAIANRALGAKK
jgi:hypothetical protein